MLLKDLKTPLKVTALLAGAVLTMGNQKCEADLSEQTSRRSLKKIVDLRVLEARSLELPNGQNFDFGYVVNRQIYDVLFKSGDFAFKYKPLVSKLEAESGLAGSGLQFNLPDSDLALLMEGASASGIQNFGYHHGKTAWCMVNWPQAKIGGSVNSFEVLGRGGLRIGYRGRESIASPGLGASLTVQRAQLDLSMNATVFPTDDLLATANVNSKQTSTALNFELIFGDWIVNPSLFFETPLARVTEVALTRAVKELQSQLVKKDWYTRVIANFDTHLDIVGGENVGLQVGDELVVYNEDYIWEGGEPCVGRFFGGTTPAIPVAKIIIEAVGEVISRGRVIEQTDENAEIGAKVKLHKFHTHLE